jgi:nucleotide-binding universal stress UspA family protein
MLGKSARYVRLPYFFSDQYDVGMEYTGYATEWDEVAVAALDRVRAAHPGTEVSVSVVHGPAEEVLAEASRSASLVVVGSRGHGGFAGMMLGSVGHSVLRKASSPVAVVRWGAW